MRRGVRVHLLLSIVDNATLSAHGTRDAGWPACAPLSRMPRHMEGTPLITAVVFDMDGVLCRYRIERRLALLAAWSGQTPDAIHGAIWRSGFEDEAERGALSADAYLS